MFEILIFALLSFYILFKLFSVLGTRTGNEKKGDFWGKLEDSEEKINDREAHKAENQGSQSDIVLTSKDFISKTTIGSKIEKLKETDSQFNPNEFLNNAEQAFLLILESHSKAKISILEKLLAPELFEKFKKSIEHHLKQKEIHQTIVHKLESDIQDIEIEGNSVKISVWFKTWQEKKVLDFDESILAKDESPRWVIDVWVFEKDMKDSDPTWKLVKIEQNDEE
jgi:predicted lipid-binding transport protein (Tim44 family)